jgi:flagellar biosynthesis/type III secretory pathway protein FliH
MSPSARRLTGAVATDRFQWQCATAPAAAVTPLLKHEPAVNQGPTPVMRDLPSPSAERIQAIEREAFAKGYAEGERAGEAAAASRIEAMLKRLATTIDEVGALRAGAMRRAEREIVRLALAMAERVLRRELDVDRELLVVMARVAIDRLGQNVVATVHLNPADCEAAMRHRDPEHANAIEIVADVNVPRGGCLVRSAFGSIDAGIDSQMRELSRALLGDEPSEEETHGLNAGA